MFTPSLIHSVELYNSISVGGSGLVRGGVCLQSANGNPTVGFCGAKAPQGEDKREHAGEPLLRRQEQQRGT
jgi:hypothetical protein